MPLSTNFGSHDYAHLLFAPTLELPITSICSQRTIGGTLKLLRVGPQGNESPVVLTDDRRLLDISSVTRDIDIQFIAGLEVDSLRERLAQQVFPEVEGSPRIGPCIANPGKIVCIGLNYRDHALETKAAVPDEPVVFMKATNTLVGPNDCILIPRQSTKTDWEVELAVIVGSRARYLASVDAAEAVIAGYAISNDVSEREFQLERGGQWDKGKSCETFNPFGPWLVTADEVPDPQALGLRLWVNGVQRQDGTTKDMIFTVKYLIWYLSQFMVLDPGDIVNTGTPAGVSLADPDVPYLRAEDIIEVEIDGLGRQRQDVRHA